MATDYTEDVVEELGLTLTASEGAGSFGPDSIKWDCTIGGLNFLFGNNERGESVEHIFRDLPDGGVQSFPNVESNDGPERAAFLAWVAAGGVPETVEP